MSRSPESPPAGASGASAAGVSGAVWVDIPVTSVADLRSLVSRLSQWGVDEWRDVDSGEGGWLRVTVLDSSAGDQVVPRGQQWVAGVQIARFRADIVSQTCEPSPLAEVRERWGRPNQT